MTGNMEHVPTQRGPGNDGEDAPAPPDIAVVYTKKAKLGHEGEQTNLPPIENQPPQAEFTNATVDIKSSDDISGRSDGHGDHTDEQVVSKEPEQAFKLNFRTDREPEFGEWLTTISVSYTCNGKEIGAGFARYIHREKIRPNFWHDMGGLSRDMSSLAFGVFDRYGYLQTILKEHPVQKGSGVWGSELDYGPLLLIERFEITEDEWKRKGRGRIMANALIKRAHGLVKRAKPKFTRYSDEALDGGATSTLHILVIPGFLTRHVERESEGKSKSEAYEIRCKAFDGAVAFWRSLGFRRIGASDCLALSLDRNHKSHAIVSEDDFDLPFIEPELSDDDSDDETPTFLDESAEKKQKATLEKLKITHPLHHATLTLSDTNCVEFYKAFSSNDPACWKQVDHSLDTVLHIAAQKLKPRSIQWLMANVGEDLASARDKNGYTPFESLQRLVEDRRTRRQYWLGTADMSDRFLGSSPRVTRCLCILVGLGTVDASAIESLRLKYGCTCGECVGGYISRRMRLALLFHAEMAYDQLDLDMGSGELWCLQNRTMIVHVRQDIRHYFHTSGTLRQGFVRLFAYIVACLKSNAVPTKQIIVNDFAENDSEWPVIKNYLEEGGSTMDAVEGALQIVFNCAREGDEKCGSGAFEALMEEELSGLKVCRNDHEYGFVAAQCGVLDNDNYYGWLLASIGS